MDEPSDLRLEALRKSAREVSQGWTPDKLAMAFRAAGLDATGGVRESLDAIAVESGVSRETVRRARNDLLAAIADQVGGSEESLLHAKRRSLSRSAAGSPATARALRRLLTMTGPLAWDEVLSAWARAGGKHPYSPLPSDFNSLREWAREAGVIVAASEHKAGLVTVLVEHPERLDKVGEFLYAALRRQANGIDRGALLEEAERAGLKATTIATALSQHPAIVRLGRGTWALRGHRHPPAPSKGTPTPRRADRPRPTTFSWADDGTLVIEFSIPRNPSPVVAVPKAVADLVEGREFRLEGRSDSGHISIGNARLWGFGPLVSEQGFAAGQRARLLINLLAGTASLIPAERKDPQR